MVFSDTSTNLGILQQVRDFARVDSSQWATSKVVNSCNNYHDLVTGYLIASDRRFQWDDTNHSKLPEGKIDLTINQTDYSFLTDEQGNQILTLLGVDLLGSDGIYKPLQETDIHDAEVTPEFGQHSGTPTQYDKIADNIIRLNYKPTATVSNGLRFRFQRVGSRFAATDTTKEPGVPQILHRGYVIAGAYDCALTLGLPSLQGLSIERQREEEKMIRYLSGRNNDSIGRIVANKDSNK